MSPYQRAKRIAYWRGSAVTAIACTAFMLASALAGAITN
jgi:hypothetical protein